MPEVIVSNEFHMGRGINSLTGIGYGVAIEYDPPQSEDSGQRTIMMLESITSSRELSEKLSIDASASMKKSIWGASASFNMVQSREVNSYYTYALIRVEVMNPSLLLRNPRLKKEAIDKFKQDGWDGFVSLYGSEYIQGKITGGTYYAMIEIQTENAFQQKNAKAKLSGHYGNFVASASVETAFKEIQKETAMNIFVAQSGGSGDVIEKTLDEMIDQAINFPKLVKDNPSTIYYITAEYKNNVNFPSIPPEDPLVRINQRNHLNDLGKRYLELRDYKSSVQFILDHLADFDDFKELSAEQLIQKRIEFKESLEATAKDIDTIVKNSTICTGNASKCDTYTPIATILPLPTIKGDIMRLKQLEDNVKELQQNVINLQGNTSSLGNILNGKSTVDGGYIRKNYSAINHPIATGGDKRTDIIHVDFAQGRFGVAPSVVVMLNSFEFVNHSTVNIFPINITNSGFDCAVEVWWDTHLHAFSATWVAYTPR